eukprot:TRINITY_DN22697_c0_g1_i1.p1 TRINITY_DN22697_c0_g1~~TRINITY_DN22697_c0_g1_i1.p1  ORF type:complete len:789 (+),score=230.87 TRINITY_DN22697_c0_g1_i1:120-2486(+)
MSGCHACGAPRSGFHTDHAAGKVSCTACGAVQEENILTDEAWGPGRAVATVGGRPAQAWQRAQHVPKNRAFGATRMTHKRCIEKARQQIDDFALLMDLSEVVPQAVRVYRMAMQRRLVGSKKFTVLCAACLYVGARMQPSHSAVRAPMLIDFSKVVTDSPFAIGSAYEYLVSNLHLEVTRQDPCLQIPRFLAALGIKKRAQAITESTMGLVARMERNWITQGRRPAGVVASALYLACRINGYTTVKLEDVTRVLATSNALALKRLDEMKASCKEVRTAQQATEEGGDVRSAIPAALREEYRRDELIKRFLRKKGKSTAEIAREMHAVRTNAEVTEARGRLQRHDKKQRKRVQNLALEKIKRQNQRKRARQAMISKGRELHAPGAKRPKHGDGDGYASDATQSSCTVEDSAGSVSDAGSEATTAASLATSETGDLSVESMSQDSLGLPLDWYYVYLQEKRDIAERLERLEREALEAKAAKQDEDNNQLMEDMKGEPWEDDGEVDEFGLPATFAEIEDTDLKLDTEAGNDEGLQDALNSLLQEDQVKELERVDAEAEGDAAGQAGGGNEADVLADLGIDLEGCMEGLNVPDGDDGLADLLDGALDMEGAAQPATQAAKDPPKVDENNNYVETMELGEANFDGLSDVSDDGFEDWVVTDPEEIKVRKEIWIAEHGDWLAEMRERKERDAKIKLMRGQWGGARIAGQKVARPSPLMPSDDGAWETAEDAVREGLAAHGTRKSSFIDYSNLDNLLGKLKGVVEKEGATDMSGVLDDLGLADGGDGGGEDFGLV